MVLSLVFREETWCFTQGEGQGIQPRDIVCRIMAANHEGSRRVQRRAASASHGRAWMTRHHERRKPLMHAQQIIATHPQVKGNTNDALIRCIEQCYDCGQACIACADACLGEDMVAQLAQCIRSDLDCADACFATGAVASRRTGSNEAVIRAMLTACETACRACAEECERHAGHHEHCRICAEACRACERACGEALRSMQPG
ncbi:four-helix bundle copper-binding protein [Falsiroseomonas sp.]|uniref:four-helix bundle copper-binding protein n=2 Tax=unclassified Falsiroseomonas TaxID=2870720 RepID=UPI0027242E72|nr:four-helix bundle copper-binding protein [Falsiroseomonas sp.]MDO9501421.1 four-helix bundle copper-binding protein [Falsiroseomonas sp.]